MTAAIEPHDIARLLTLSTPENVCQRLGERGAPVERRTDNRGFDLRVGRRVGRSCIRQRIFAIRWVG